MEDSEKVTICMPCFNSLPTIKQVLSVLNFQDVYPRIMILDNGSKDGTFEAIGGALYHGWFRDLKIELLFFGQVSARENKNIESVRNEFCKKTKTPYIFFLDSDVLIPPYVIKPMIASMEQRADLGMLGLKYDVLAGHVKMGATILPTAIAKQIKWRYDEQGCDCLNCAKELLIRGMKVEHYPAQTARHLLAN